MKSGRSVSSSDSCSKPRSPRNQSKYMRSWRFLAMTFDGFSLFSLTALTPDISHVTFAQSDRQSPDLRIYRHHLGRFKRNRGRMAAGMGKERGRMLNIRCDPVISTCHGEERSKPALVKAGEAISTTAPWRNPRNGMSNLPAQKPRQAGGNRKIRATLEDQKCPAREIWEVCTSITAKGSL